jgi:hypothetical protein
LMLVMPRSETMPLSKWPRDLAAVMTASSVDEKYANRHSCRVGITTVTKDTLNRRPAC